MDNYGFAVTIIMRNSPKGFTVRFGEPRGKVIRENYGSMNFESVGADGQNKSRMIFKNVTETAICYAYRSPTGPFSETEFIQPALTFMYKAPFEDMRASGLIQDDSVFARRSPGEYSALAAPAEGMLIEPLLSINRMVSRNLQLCLINHKYVSAGDLRSVGYFTNGLKFLKVQKIDIQALTGKMPHEDVKKRLVAIIQEWAESHSSDNFSWRIKSSPRLSPASLLENLSPKPRRTLSTQQRKEYFEEMYKLTNSQRIGQSSANWSRYNVFTGSHSSTPRASFRASSVRDVIRGHCRDAVFPPRRREFAWLNLTNPLPPSYGCSLALWGYLLTYEIC
ncbi:hypothetical protein B9Z19DRAFT_1172004 [Tuber borchii]|uniref:Malonyl-CoA:ACP transacylase (MAT) domain-containing protein n=1 Tax=Tuber borchii TaxID=42251 RepID=A0A2T6ZY29_TUBBO|nr:hypothetical protein B9Z19DRAFT_1172004 [Tuber borchii]